VSESSIPEGRAGAPGFFATCAALAAPQRSSDRWDVSRIAAPHRHRQSRSDVVLLGWLVFRSALLPRILGLLLAVGGLAYLDKRAPSARGIQRWVVTPTWWHISTTGQVEHLGAWAVQMCLPNGTSRALMSSQ
jgi:hypothetical protein